MNLLRVVIRRGRALFRKESLDLALDEEIRHHLDAQIRRNLAVGMSLHEAHAAAHRSFGGVELVKDRCRDERRIGWAEHAIKDLRYGLRILKRNPGFTSV